MIGPGNPFSQQLHATKYRASGESFDDYCVRWSRTLKDSDAHFLKLLRGTRDLRMLPGGRQQLAVGRGYQVTAYNCFVMGTIPDSTEGIFSTLSESAKTLRVGGGIGMDFSTLRPEGEPIRGLGHGAYSSGPVSFMRTWDAMSTTICSAGERRGAMMAVLRCDHPDIMKFVHAKRGLGQLEHFNVSVAVTDAFMQAVVSDGLFQLSFGGRSFGDMRALDVWSTMMESNWDYAEPGVIFIDTVNRMNPLGYCETIAASNPCGEQMLPPYGACLLGSQNVARYLVPEADGSGQRIDVELWRDDARAMVRAFDRVIDVSRYPLAPQEQEAKAKRRIGLGVTGMANALAVLGLDYGTPLYCQVQRELLEMQRDAAVRESVQLAIERGPFPAFDAEGWLGSGWAKTLPEDLRELVARHGIRNGQLLSIAPTGTISWVADNVSSGIEPPFALEATREVIMPSGKQVIDVSDYALVRYGVRGRTAREVTPEEHVRVLASAQAVIDNAVSKTINVWGARSGAAPEAGEIGFEQFKDVYRLAWELGCKGCTTYNANGKRKGILEARSGERDPVAEACFVDENGRRECA